MILITDLKVKTCRGLAYTEEDGKQFLICPLTPNSKAVFLIPVDNIEEVQKADFRREPGHTTMSFPRYIPEDPDIANDEQWARENCFGFAQANSEAGEQSVEFFSSPEFS